MERWNIGVLGIERGESAPFGLGALRLRIADFILRDEGPEARGKEFLAFSLKSAGGGRSSNLYQGNAAKSEFFRNVKGKVGGKGNAKYQSSNAKGERLRLREKMK